MDAGAGPPLLLSHTNVMQTRRWWMRGSGADDADETRTPSLLRRYTFSHVFAALFNPWWGPYGELEVEEEAKKDFQFFMFVNCV